MRRSLDYKPNDPSLANAEPTDWESVEKCDFADLFGTPVCLYAR